MLYADKTVYVFVRALERDEILIAVNSDTASANVQFEVKGLQSRLDKLLYGEAKVAWVTEPSHYLELNLPPRSGCVLG